MSLKSLNNIFKGDKVIWMVFFLLCMISIVEVYSASSTLSYKGGNYWAPLLKHGGMLFIGFIVMIVVMNIKCRYFKIATLPALVLSVLMLIGVLLTGGVTNGASRWIEVMGIQFQPSELGKGALVLAVAQILSAMQTEAGAAKKAFKYILFLSAAIIIPISFENLSTALLASLTVLLMMFVGRGAEQSYCILVTSQKLTTETRKRIDIMCDTNDGFEIAEADLKLRGPGDLEGTQQSGIAFDLKIADIARDGLLVQLARDEAKKIIDNDPTCSKSEYNLLWNRLKELRKANINWAAIS